MLKKIAVRNLTVFAEADLRFGKHLNVFVGENGTGKSHLLKLAYSTLAASAEEGRRPDASAPTKSVLQPGLADKLVTVFRPEVLGRLARRRRGRERCSVEIKFDEKELDTSFHFATSSKSEVLFDLLPKTWVSQPPVFLPTRELLTIYPGFVSLYEGHYVEFEETWRDTCLLLGAPALRGPKEKSINELLKPLNESMGGKVELDPNGRFYLRTANAGRFEMALVAEGLRKLAMVARLIATGSLVDKGYLFWDEPETNLNPKLIREIAGTILHLCQSGIQVFVATHSLFLLRELDIMLGEKDFAGLDTRYFGLHFDGDGVRVEQGKTSAEIGDISALDEQIRQSDRYLAVEV